MLAQNFKSAADLGITDTSDPQDWMEAALYARQHRNVLTRLKCILRNTTQHRGNR